MRTAAAGPAAGVTGFLMTFRSHSGNVSPRRSRAFSRLLPATSSNALGSFQGSIRRTGEGRRGSSFAQRVQVPSSGTNTSLVWMAWCPASVSTKTRLPFSSRSP